MKISKKSLVSFIIISFSLFLILSPGFFVGEQVPLQVKAQSAALEGQFAMDDIAPIFNGDANPPEDMRLVITKMIRWALSFLALIFLILVLVSGFKWMTSGGNEEIIKDAQKNLINATIGLVIILSAWIITTYFIIVLNKLIINQRIDFNVF